MQLITITITHLKDHMVGHPRCVSINYIWFNQLSNTTNLWWIDVYYQPGNNKMLQTRRREIKKYNNNSIYYN